MNCDPDRLDDHMAEWLPPDYADTEAGHGGQLFHDGRWWTPAEIRAHAGRLIVLAAELEGVVKVPS